MVHDDGRLETYNVIKIGYVNYIIWLARVGGLIDFGKSKIPISYFGLVDSSSLSEERLSLF